MSNKQKKMSKQLDFSNKTIRHLFLSFAATEKQFFCYFCKKKNDAHI